MDVATIVVRYEVSDEALREEMIATGGKPARRRELTLSLAELTPEQRQPLVDHLLSDVAQLDMSHPVTFDPTAYNGNGYVSLYWDHVPTVDEVIATATADLVARAAIVAHEKERERARQAQAAKDRAEREAIRASEYEREQKREEEKAAAQAAFDAELRRWATEHGSDRLKLCLAGDYRCDRIYVVERAALEHPGWTVDFYDKAGWKERTNPSLAALQAARDASASATVVWLTAFPSDAPGSTPDDDAMYGGDDPDYAGLPREALVIRGYLTKYDLVQVL